MAAGWHGQGCWAAGTALLGLLAWQPAGAGPVVCATSLEAPQPGGAPVEVTRCGPLTSTSDLVERRFYSYTAPFARGVNLTHQLTDLLGIALGGGDGTRLMGLGFPDQTIVWDGSALEATTGESLRAVHAALRFSSSASLTSRCRRRFGTSTSIMSPF